jgi:hypothetical protein
VKIGMIAPLARLKGEIKRI